MHEANQEGVRDMNYIVEQGDTHWVAIASKTKVFAYGDTKNEAIDKLVLVLDTAWEYARKKDTISARDKWWIEQMERYQYKGALGQIVITNEIWKIIKQSLEANGCSHCFCLLEIDGSNCCQCGKFRPLEAKQMTIEWQLTDKELFDLRKQAEKITDDEIEIIGFIADTQVRKLLEYLIANLPLQSLKITELLISMLKQLEAKQ